jgi:hypothetical protein
MEQDPCGKTQEECEAHSDKKWRLSLPRETCKALTVIESAAGAWNTAGPWWLCAGLFNPGVAGAGEICIPSTRILTTLGQLRTHNSGGVQVCDEYHRWPQVKLPCLLAMEVTCFIRTKVLYKQLHLNSWVVCGQWNWVAIIRPHRSSFVGLIQGPLPM